ncbi:MAG: hypothetical protein RL134_2071, partial [Actinomycetota bacterium]
MGSAVLISPAAPAPEAHAAPAIASVTPPTTTLAIIKDVVVPHATSLDIDDDDDTVYLGAAPNPPLSPGASGMRVFDGRSGTLSGSSIVFNLDQFGGVNDVAVDDHDDTVYASLRSGALVFAVGAVNGRRLLDDSFVTTLNMAALQNSNVRGIAADPIDDSVYGTNASNYSVAIKLNGRKMDDSTVLGLNAASQCTVRIDPADDSVYFAGYDMLSIVNGRNWQTPTPVNVVTGAGCFTDLVAVNEADDSVYVGQATNGYISVIKPRPAIVDDTITVGRYPRALAVDQADDTVYVAHSQYQSGTNYGRTGVSIINGRSGEATDDTIALGVYGGEYNTSFAIEVDQVGPNAGLVYVVRRDDATGTNGLSVIGRVSPTVSPPAGPSGTTATVTVDAPQVTYDLDNAAVDKVYFDDTQATPTAGAGDTWTVPVPAGSGTVQVRVKFRGGLMASAGTFTYGTVAPLAPALAPLTAGDDTIGLTWTEGFNGG